MESVTDILVPLIVGLLAYIGGKYQVNAGANRKRRLFKSRVSQAAERLVFVHIVANLTYPKVGYPNPEDVEILSQLHSMIEHVSFLSHFKFEDEDLASLNQNEMRAALEMQECIEYLKVQKNQMLTELDSYGESPHKEARKENLLRGKNFFLGTCDRVINCCDRISGRTTLKPVGEQFKAFGD